MSLCCASKRCQLAYMDNAKCYGVKCYSEELCKITTGISTNDVKISLMVRNDINRKGKSFICRDYQKRKMKINKNKIKIQFVRSRSDQHLICLFNISTESNIQVIRVKEMNKFSCIDFLGNEQIRVQRICILMLVVKASTLTYCAANK